jgi:hypothetical protein
MQTGTLHVERLEDRTHLSGMVASHILPLTQGGSGIQRKRDPDWIAFQRETVVEGAIGLLAIAPGQPGFAPVGLSYFKLVVYQMMNK